MTATINQTRRTSVTSRSKYSASPAHTPAIFLLAERDELVAPRFHRLVVSAYAGEKRLIELHGAFHNDPIAGAALADLNDALGWLLADEKH